MISLVTGNPNKLRELRQVFPPEFVFEAIKLDLDEIQTLDTHELVRHKLLQAYEKLRRPVIVEDVSAELENLNGLPGPFVKYFQQRLGSDALYKLGGEGAVVKIICTMGYYDGERKIVVDGVVHGTVTQPRGSGGFGFDVCVVPEGHAQTFAQMPMALKNERSHRYYAAKSMLQQLVAAELL